MMLTDYMCQEEVKEEDLPALKATLTHRYNDMKSTYKSAEEDWFQQPKIILTTRGPAERQLLESKSGKKNKSMGALSD